MDGERDAALDRWEEMLVKSAGDAGFTGDFSRLFHVERTAFPRADEPIGVFAGMPVVASEAVAPGEVQLRYVHMSYRMRLSPAFAERLRAMQATPEAKSLLRERIRQLLEERWPHRSVSEFWR